MSWDASFDGGWWNYTHNTAPMIYQVLKDAGTELDPGESWWKRLDGMTGPEAAAYLGQVIDGLEAEPGRFRAMNPENGWGDYDSLLMTLRSMRAASRAPQCCDHECPNPQRWSASG